MTERIDNYLPHSASLVLYPTTDDACFFCGAPMRGGKPQSCGEESAGVPRVVFRSHGERIAMCLLCLHSLRFRELQTGRRDAERMMFAPDAHYANCIRRERARIYALAQRDSAEFMRELHGILDFSSDD